MSKDVILKLQVDSTGAHMLVYSADRRTFAQGPNFLNLPSMTRKFIRGHVARDGKLNIAQDNLPEQGW